MTPEERRAQLVAQAQHMRERREAKKTEVHVCPPGGLDSAVARLLKALERNCKGNESPIPIATSYEIHPDTDYEPTGWYCDVTVKIPGKADYSVTGFSSLSLEEAVRNATGAVCQPADNHRRSRRDAERYGFTL